jgi:hypothetical protein
MLNLSKHDSDKKNLNRLRQAPRNNRDRQAESKMEIR